MSKILIPRSDSISAKVVEPSDFEEMNSYVEDHIRSGFTVTAGSGLAVDVSSGKIKLKGLHVNNTASESVTGLSASTTNHIFVKLNRDGNSEAEAWDFDHNTSGTAPADSIKIATATTDASTVTAVDQTFISNNIGEPALVPKGGIIMWSGLTTDIPTGWLLCDGTSGTPNLIAKFIRGLNSASADAGTTGGSDTVNVVVPRNKVTWDRTATGGGTQSESPTDTGTPDRAGDQSYASLSPVSADANADTVAGNWSPFGTQNQVTHYGGTATMKTDGVTVSSVENKPAFFEVAFIMRV